MKITISKDFGATIDLTPQETTQLTSNCYWYKSSEKFFRGLGEKLSKEIDKKKAVPIFILAGNLTQARDYAKKRKIKIWSYIGHGQTYCLRGYKDMKLHYVGNWHERCDLVGMGCILSGMNVKAVYEF